MAERSKRKAKRGKAESRIPPGMSAFVKKRVASGGFKSVEDYLRHLVREDHRRAEAEMRLLTQLIREGMDSGPGIPVNDEYFESLRERIRARSQPARKAG